MPQVRFFTDEDVHGVVAERQLVCSGERGFLKP